MWQRIVFLSTASAVFLQALLLMAEPPPSPAPRLTARSLWTKTDWVRLEIVSGRLTVQSSRCGQCRIVEGGSDTSPTRQTLNIHSQPATLVVNYELACEKGRVALELNESEELSLTRTDCEGVATVCYSQAAKGPVTLEAGALKLTAGSLWHLTIAEPKACQQHLFPLLAELRPGWRIDQQVGEIEAALRAQAGSDVVLRRQQWQSWLEELAANKFSDRQAADLRLRSAGQPVLSFLRQLDPGQLQPEQRRRVRSMLADLADAGPDTPQRVAGWLVDDKQVWLALLARGDLGQRIAAADHLTKLCQRSLAFDPQASDALRHAQLAQLREMLAEN